MPPVTVPLVTMPLVTMPLVTMPCMYVPWFSYRALGVHAFYARPLI